MCFPTDHIAEGTDHLLFPLVLLSRTPAYPPFRVVGAVTAGVAALGWIAERALGWTNPIGAQLDRIATHGIWLAAGLAALALGSTLAQRMRRLPVLPAEAAMGSQYQH